MPRRPVDWLLLTALRARAAWRAGLGTAIRGTSWLTIIGAVSCQADVDAGPTGDSDSGESEGPACGNGLVERDEACDLGFANRDDGRCTTACRDAVCGDGFVGPAEACDPAATEDCGSDCTIPSSIVWLEQVGGTAERDDGGLDVALDGAGRIYATAWLIDQEAPRTWVGSFEPDGTLRYQRSWPVDACPFGGTTRSIVDADGTVYLAVIACSDRTTLHRIEPDGELGWSIDATEATGVASFVGGFALGPDDRLVASYGGALVWFERSTGAVANTVAVEEPVLHLVLTPEGTVFGASDGELVVYAADGTLQHREEVRSWTIDLALDEDAVVVVRDAKDVTAPGPRIERRGFDGSLLQWQPIRGDDPTTPVEFGGISIADDGTAVVAVQWSAEVGRSASDRDAGVVAFDRSLQERWRLRYAGPAGAPDRGNDAVLLDGDVVLVGQQSVALAGTEAFVARLRPPAARQRSVGSPRSSRRRTAAAPTRSASPRPDTVFVDFHGGRLVPGTNSALGEAACVEAPFDYPAYTGSSTDAATALSVARTILQPYAVRVVDEAPPVHLPYQRVVVGGLAQDFGLDPTIRGLSCGIDCGDAVRRETVFVFGQSAASPEELGQVIAHEAAHRWGLEHVDGETDLMHPSASESRTDVVDECLPLAGASTCPDAHALYCPEGTEQRAHAELAAVLGLASTDDEAPRITIVSPLEGDTLVAGERSTIEVLVEDDRPAHGWSFAVPELDWTWPAFEGETSLELQFPTGVFTLEVQATDQAGHTTSARVRVRVRDPGDVGGPEPPDDEGERSSCAIAGPHGGPLGLLVLLGARRRRPAATQRRRPPDTRPPRDRTSAPRKLGILAYPDRPCSPRPPLHP